jgi:TonB-dependent receptor
MTSPSPTPQDASGAAAGGTDRRVARRAGSALWVAWLAFALLLGALAGPARAQEDVSDVFGDLGTTSTVDEEDEQETLQSEDLANAGKIRGRVLDGNTGAPVRDVTVILIWPDPGDGSEARQEVATTDFDGEYEFAAVPAGTYTLNFVKSGYRASTMTDFRVQAQQVNRGDFPMPPIPTATSSEILQLDAFVVEQSTVDELMTSLELRLDSDALLNTFSAEEFSKFAAGDVAEALRRVAGVNVVEGQFAIIRGLEDRYSATLFNGAAVPSPDPDSQSVQLDLFPSDVVGSLNIQKTFSPFSPSNASGGSLDIVTLTYPDEFEFKISVGSGFNDNATDRFLEYQDESPIGKEKDAEDVVETEFGATFGGRRDFFDRDFRIKGVVNWEIDYETGEGFKQDREPQRGITNVLGQVTQVGDLSLGELSLNGGKFDLTQSEREEQLTAYGAFGFDIDEAGDHKIDASVFYTDKEVETVRLQEFGYWPNFDYQPLIDLTLSDTPLDTAANALPWRGFVTFGSQLRSSLREDFQDFPSRGAPWFASFFESDSFRSERDLLITQLNGDHTISQVEGLHFSWAANYATTSQDEESYGAEYWYEPDDLFNYPTDPDAFPVKPGDLGPGQYAVAGSITSNSAKIDEDQWFVRFDADYERDLVDEVALEMKAGGWYEYADRNVDAKFLESPTVGGLSQFAILAPTQLALGDSLFEELDATPEGRISGLRDSTNKSEREIQAVHVGSKFTLFDQIDLIGGVRLEDIRIESKNEAFTGELDFSGTPAIYPNKWLFFDRLDNPTRNEVIAPPAADTPFNDLILGVNVPIDRSTDVCDAPDAPEVRRGCVDLTSRSEVSSAIDGKIDEEKVLPSFGVAWRPVEELAFRGAYSQTVARPSFREMGYYVTTEPGSDDLIVGNPQLKLSDVESWDVRAEYSWGDLGDLFAISGFYKTIEDPIESIVIRDPVNFENDSSSQFRTFFNNESKATLWGIEVEGRKAIDFVGLDFLKYLSIGGNFTYIDAEVERSDTEIQRASGFFALPEGENAKFTSLNKKRRLFAQPEWIANADITFDHPDWGTRITLAYFAISDLLDAAGSGVVQPNGEVITLTLDRYVDSFYQLDLIASQSFDLPWEAGRITLKTSMKNLTNSTRRIVYDPEQLNSTITERALKVGRDYSFSFTYLITF